MNGDRMLKVENHRRYLSLISAEIKKKIHRNEHVRDRNEILM
jgi:hypothetical protein